MSESKKTSDDGSIESRGLKARWIDRDDEEEEEEAIFMVCAIRVENKFLHLVCLNVGFVRVASCVWIYLFLSRVNPRVPKTQPNPKPVRL